MQELTREFRSILLEKYAPPLLERTVLELNKKYFGFPGDLSLQCRISDDLGRDTTAGRCWQAPAPSTGLIQIIQIGTPERLSRLMPQFGYEEACYRVLAHEMLHTKSRLNGDLDPTSHFDNTFVEYSKAISKAEGWGWDYEKLPSWGLF